MCRANKLEFLNRVNDVVYLMSMGMNTPDILKYAVEKGWDLTARSVHTYIRHARDKICKILDTNANYYLARGVHRYDDLYLNSHRIEDWKTCAVVQEKLEALLGLRTIKVENKTEINVTFDIEKLNENG